MMIIIQKKSGKNRSLKKQKNLAYLYSPQILLLMMIIIKIQMKSTILIPIKIIYKKKKI